MNKDRTIFILKELWCFREIDEPEQDIREAIDIAINALEKNDSLEARITELEKELEESRAKEGKGALETAIESFGQLVASLNEAMQGMSSEEIKELLRPDEEEEDQ